MATQKPIFGIQCIGRKDGSLVTGTGTVCGAMFHAHDQQQQFEAHVKAEHPLDVGLLLAKKSL